MKSASSGLIIGSLFTSLLPGSCAPKSICTTNGANTPASVVTATDQTHYASKQAVKLIVTNNLDVPVWYIAYSQPDLVFWELERPQDNGWERVDFRLPLIEGGLEVCRLILYEQPIGEVTELKPRSRLSCEWNQKICLFQTPAEPTEPQLIERGRYRFALRYSLETVKTEGVETQPWRRPLELGETNVVYSNEFFLE